MVRYLALVLLLGGCTSVPQTSNPQKPEQQILDLEPLVHVPTKPLDYPKNLENTIKSAVTVVYEERENRVVYTPVFVGNPADNHQNLPMPSDSDKLYTLVDTQTIFEIRDAVVAARENNKLVERLDKVLDLSVQERNQLLRIIKLEQYQMQRMQEFNTYYKEEIERQEKSHTIDSLTWRIITALALAVAI